MEMSKPSSDSTGEEEAENEDTDTETDAVPSTSEALILLERLRCYCDAQNDGASVYAKINKLDDYISSKLVRKQLKISDFLN